MRPLGEIAHALWQAAATPGTVRQHCERAQVGYDVGRYTASRLVQRGLLERLPEAVAAPWQGVGPGRPAAVVVRSGAVDADAPTVLQVMQRSFWEQPTAPELAADWDAA
jgi:hypothetical protein